MEKDAIQPDEAPQTTAINNPKSDHKWHSQEYVEEWIASRIQLDEERRPRIREMLSYSSLLPDEAVHVLDIGGGYGVVTEEVLQAFPLAKVTLQDYSQPMLNRAQERLRRFGAQVNYVLSDLRDPSWVHQVDGPFDLAVSAQVIHNLVDHTSIGACYRAIACVLKPGTAFLNYDLVDNVGGVTAQETLLRAAGFHRVECLWYESPRAIIAAFQHRSAQL
jgi:ubiquinone/menaquinone biosynthesis C-methylase UbiE